MHNGACPFKDDDRPARDSSVIASAMPGFLACPASPSLGTALGMTHRSQ